MIIDPRRHGGGGASKPVPQLQGTVQSRDESCAPWGEPGPVPAGDGAWQCSGYCDAEAAQDQRAAYLVGKSRCHCCCCFLKASGWLLAPRDMLQRLQLACQKGPCRAKMNASQHSTEGAARAPRSRPGSDAMLRNIAPGRAAERRGDLQRHVGIRAHGRSRTQMPRCAVCTARAAPSFLRAPGSTGHPGPTNDPAQRPRLRGGAEWGLGAGAGGGGGCGRAPASSILKAGPNLLRNGFRGGGGPSDRDPRGLRLHGAVLTGVAVRGPPRCCAPTYVTQHDPPPPNALSMLSRRSWERVLLENSPPGPLRSPRSATRANVYSFRQPPSLVMSTPPV